MHLSLLNTLPFAALCRCVFRSHSGHTMGLAPEWPSRMNTYALGCEAVNATRLDVPRGATCHTLCVTLQAFKAAGQTPFEIDTDLLAREQPGLVLTQVRRYPS